MPPLLQLGRGDTRGRRSLHDHAAQLPGYETHSTTLKGGGVDLGGYPAIRIVDDFFKKHPTWKTEAIEEAIRT